MKTTVRLETAVRIESTVRMEMSMQVDEYHDHNLQCYEYINIFTMLSRSRDSIKVTIKNVIKV